MAAVLPIARERHLRRNVLLNQESTFPRLMRKSKADQTVGGIYTILSHISKDTTRCN